MRIDVNSLSARLIPPDWGETQSAKGAQGAESANGDRTTISSQGSMIQALTAQALKLPEIRQDRVDDLRQSLSAGAYRLDATKTAAAIVESGER